MNPTSDLYLFGIPGLGMILVSVLAVVVWRRISGAELRWFGVGAGLWAVAVALKVAFSLIANQAVVSFLKWNVPNLLLLPVIGLYLGGVSAAFEVGLTWLAGWRWRFLGRDAGRAVAVGVGAGAFEALILGCVILATGLTAAAGEDSAEVRGELFAGAAATPLFWLEPPAGRIIALMGHVSSRALVLLGVSRRRPSMGLWGFVIFALVDGIGGALLASRVFAGRSMWWIDAATLPFNLIGLAVLVLCVCRYDGRESGPYENTGNVSEG